MRRLLTVLVVLLVLSVGAAAYEVPTDFERLTLEDAVTDFRAAHGLNENNFSLSYYNTETEEAYAWNDTWFAIGASTYKLPLNMYFYEMEQAGEIDRDALFSWTGRTLAQIHEESIVNSNNELSEALMFYWGDHYTYKENLRKYFSMTEEEISPLYWQANWFCTRMMMDCLKYLWDNQEQFGELLGYMKRAMPDQYFRRTVTEYEVAHKYGSVEHYNNDVGIIYTPQPFLLAVYTASDGIGNDWLCAEAAKLVTAYNVWQSEHLPAEEEPAPEPEPENAPAETLPVEVLPVEKEPEPEPKPEAENAASDELPAVSEPEKPKRSFVLPVIGGTAAAAVLLWLLRKKK